MEDWKKTKCGTCIFQRGKPICNSCMKYHLYKPMSNADKIRSMTDEELANFLDSVFNNIFDGYEFPCNDCSERINCDVCFEEWLKSEVEQMKAGGENE